VRKKKDGEESEMAAENAKAPLWKDANLIIIIIIIIIITVTEPLSPPPTLFHIHLPTNHQPHFLNQSTNAAVFHSFEVPPSRQIHHVNQTFILFIALLELERHLRPN
jgi:hypothetical protein